MTRKDYVAIAGALKAQRYAYAPHWDANLFRACNDNAKAIAEVLASDNPRFDRQRFLDACGVTP